jgi:diguanylate cyclase (GGDEF)-like protein/PAS domain S-box-containing protein
MGSVPQQADGGGGLTGLAGKVFEATTEAILVVDGSRTALFANPAFTRVTGYPLEQVIGQRLTLLDAWRHDDDFRTTVLEQIRLNGRWSGEVWIRRYDGNVVPVLQNAVAVFDADGDLSHYIFTLTDLSEHKDAQALLDFLAYHDAATGLPNRLVAGRHFDQCAHQATERGGRVAIMCVSVDRLPVIHHTLGRFFVDEALRRLGQAISCSLEGGGLVSRQSGDEFLVVTNVAGPEGAAVQAEWICAAIAEELVVDERRLALTGRVGIALFPDHGRALDDLVRCADNALHRSGNFEAGSYRFYSQEIEAEALAHVELEASLRHAIAEGEFSLVYQPKVAARDGTLMGAEALLRWNSPPLGSVSPDRFIPLAEESGLILAIDAWVVKEVCRQIAAWRGAGLDPVPISINLSAQQFQQPDLVRMVTGALREHGLPGAALELEVTEGALIHEVPRAIEVLRQLRAAGIALSLDDFGTGYSSLHYLKSLPIDTLKLDKSFVDELPDSRSDAAIALTVLALARHLRLSVVAEGVETAAQFEYLRDHGCDLIQGYYASHPLAVEAFEQLLKKGTTVLAVEQLVS